MAFQRRSPFRRRSFGRFRPRYGSRLRAPAANRVWQRANIHADVNLSTDGPETTTTATVTLASVKALGDTNQRPGDALDQALRQVRIGGIVLGRVIHPTTKSYDAADTQSDVFTICREHLFIDRLDSNGLPVASAPAYGFSQYPIANASSTGDSPNVETIETNYPLKILWTNVFRSNLTVYTVNSLPEDEGVVLDNGAIRPNPGMLNKRIRTYIDDFNSFFYSVSFITGPSFTRNQSYKIVLSGWLYYRLGF